MVCPERKEATLRQSDPKIRSDLFRTIHPSTFGTKRLRGWLGGGADTVALQGSMNRSSSSPASPWRWATSGWQAPRRRAVGPGGPRHTSTLTG